MRDTVISLCDLTLKGSQPWINAGYRAIAVDPQHETTRSNGAVTLLACTVAEALPILRENLERAVMVMAYPPCTDLARSGSKYWERKMTDTTWKHFKGPTMFVDSARVVWQCEMIGQLSGAPWFVENPVGALHQIWRKPDHTFQPWEYTGWEPSDNYTKNTCLWTGNGFVMPPKRPDLTLAPPTQRIIKGNVKWSESGNFRSISPSGFARAVMASNAR